MAPNDLLGLPADASLDDVHERFRGLAGMLHPSAGGDAAEFDRLRAAYQALVAQRCAELGVPPEAELELAGQDPWDFTVRAQEGTSSIGSELLAGAGELGRFALDHDPAAHVIGGELFGGYAAGAPRRADLDEPPMSFGGPVAATLLGVGLAMTALCLRLPDADFRLLALHGVFYLLALALLPTLLTAVAATESPATARQLWFGSALALSMGFAAFSPLPFLVAAHERHAAAEAGAAPPAAE